MEPMADFDPEILDLDQFAQPQNEIGKHSQQKCLVGKLLSDKIANPFAIMDVMKRATKKGMEAREWTSNLFLFRFNDENEMHWAIKNQPWHFNGNLFLIRPLEEREQPSKVEITEAHLWTRFYDAPVSCMNPRAAEALANKVGRFVCVDPSLDLFGKYVRVKIAVDVTKPLKKGIKVLVGGEQLWLVTKFESLPTFCFNCGLLGHSMKYCEAVDHLRDLDPLNLSFGPEIRASPFKGQKQWQPHSEPRTL